MQMSLQRYDQAEADLRRQRSAAMLGFNVPFRGNGP